MKGTSPSYLDDVWKTEEVGIDLQITLIEITTKYAKYRFIISGKTEDQHQKMNKDRDTENSFN